ncbi:hypothetical protein V3595_11265 [Bacillus sp. CFBP9009]
MELIYTFLFGKIILDRFYTGKHNGIVIVAQEFPGLKMTVPIGKAFRVEIRKTIWH